jgi:hypothetical protein
VAKAVSMSIGELRLELARRERQGAALLRTRQRLVARMLEIDRQLAALGIAPTTRGTERKARPGRTGPRFRNEAPLHEALAKAMKRRPMSIGEAIKAVRRAGYKSTARNFRLVVSVALANKKHFRRVQRGVYAVR